MRGIFNPLRQLQTPELKPDQVGEDLLTRLSNRAGVYGRVTGTGMPTSDEVKAQLTNPTANLKKMIDAEAQGPAKRLLTGAGSSVTGAALANDRQYVSSVTAQAKALGATTSDDEVMKYLTRGTTGNPAVNDAIQKAMKNVASGEITGHDPGFMRRMLSRNPIKVKPTGVPTKVAPGNLFSGQLKPSLTNLLLGGGLSGGNQMMKNYNYSQGR
jgi:hypothetical protein